MAGGKQRGMRSRSFKSVVVVLFTVTSIVSASALSFGLVRAASGTGGGGTTALTGSTAGASTPTTSPSANSVVIPSTSDVAINGYAPGPWKTEPNCVQPPDPKIKDYATFTLAEQKLYGIPTREPGESFDHWAKIVRSFKKRTCQYRDMPGLVHANLYQQSAQSTQHPADINPAGNAALAQWAGNIADEPCPACTPSQEVQDSAGNATYSYTEIDSDWYIPWVPTPSGTQGYTDLTSTDWVGLGGSNKYDQLDQAGSESIFINQIGPAVASEYYVWWEYVGTSPAQQINPQELNWNVVGGNHIWARIDGGNCYTLEELDYGWWFNYCTGPNYDEDIAEAIVEKDGKYLGSFQTARFQGVGITEASKGYQGFPNLWHDYSNMTDSHGTVMATNGPIQYDGNDYPYDDFNITWKAVGCGC